MKKTVGEIIFDILNTVFMLIMIVVTIYPILYVLFASLSDSNRLLAHSGLLLKPLGLQLKAYEEVLRNPMVVSGFANTVRQALFSPDADRICENFKSVSQKNSKQSVAAQCRALFDRLYHRMNETTEAVQ